MPTRVMIVKIETDTEAETTTLAGIVSGLMGGELVIPAVPRAEPPQLLKPRMPELPLPPAPPPRPDPRRTSAKSTPATQAEDPAGDAPAGGDFACAWPGCERTFTNASGLGRHRKAAHGVPGTSSGAKSRARQAEQPDEAGPSPSGGPGRLQRDGLTPDAEGKVACLKCGKRVGATGYGTHMRMHDRGTEPEGGTAPVDRAPIRTRTRMPVRGSGNALPGGYSVLPRATADSSSRGDAGPDEDED